VHELLKSDDDKLKKLSYLSYCERAYGAGLSWSKTKKTGYNQIPENDSKCVLLMTIKEIDRIYTYLPEDVKGVVNKLKEELKKLLLEGKHNGVKEQFQETFTNTLPKKYFVMCEETPCKRQDATKLGLMKLCSIYDNSGTNCKQLSKAEWEIPEQPKLQGEEEPEDEAAELSVASSTNEDAAESPVQQLESQAEAVAPSPSTTMPSEGEVGFGIEHLRSLEATVDGIAVNAWDRAVALGKQVATDKECTADLVAESSKDYDETQERKKIAVECLANKMKLELPQFTGTKDEKILVNIVALIEWEATAMVGKMEALSTSAAGQAKTRAMDLVNGFTGEVMKAKQAIVKAQLAVKEMKAQQAIVKAQLAVCEMHADCSSTQYCRKGNYAEEGEEENLYQGCEDLDQCLEYNDAIDNMCPNVCKMHTDCPSTQYCQKGNYAEEGEEEDLYQGCEELDRCSEYKDAIDKVCPSEGHPVTQTQGSGDSDSNSDEEEDNQQLMALRADFDLQLAEFNRLMSQYERTKALFTLGAANTLNFAEQEKAYNAIAEIFGDNQIYNAKDNKVLPEEVFILSYNKAAKVIDALKKTKSRSFRALANGGGVCRHWASLLKRLILTMFPDGYVEVEKVDDYPVTHQWVRIKLGNVCTHADSFHAAGGVNEKGEWIKNAELETKVIYKTIEVMKAIDDHHNMDSKWDNCA